MDAERKSPNATLEQAAAFLQMSERWVLNCVENGLLNPIYFGKRRFFRWSELEKLAKRGVPAEAKQEQTVND